MLQCRIHPSRTYAWARILQVWGPEPTALAHGMAEDFMLNSDECCFLALFTPDNIESRMSFRFLDLNSEYDCVTVME